VEQEGGGATGRTKVMVNPETPNYEEGKENRVTKGSPVRKNE